MNRTRILIVSSAGAHMSALVLAALTSKGFDIATEPSPPGIHPYDHGHGRKRAQWKKETNKRGRSR